MGERMNEIVLCVCEQKTVCMLDGERSTLHDTDECTYATLGQTDSVTLFGIDVIVTRRSGF